MSLSLFRLTFQLTLSLLAASLCVAWPQSVARHGAASAQSKISPSLRGVGTDETVEVIVRYTQSQDRILGRNLAKGLAKHEVSQENLPRTARVRAHFPRIRSSALSLRASDIVELAQDPNVEHISPDRKVRATLDYAVHAIGADLAQRYGFNGKGIGIAVIDSGIKPKHGSDFNKIVYQESFVEDKVEDKYGHGTHVAGIVAGTGEGYAGMNLGVAPAAGIINLRVLDENGVGTDSGVIAAIQRAIDLKNVYNIRVINLSLGRPVYESFEVDPLCQAVKAAWDAGIVVVVAAGNMGRDDSFDTKGYGTIISPANHPLVITVGAMKTKRTAPRPDDEIASYSSKGPTVIDHVVKPDIVAPGNGILSLRTKATSLLGNEFPENKVGDSFRLSGTSMAAPMVSGAVALLLQQNPNLTPDQVKARLMQTASKVFPVNSTATDPSTGQTFVSDYDIFTVGAGYLDVNAALNESSTAPAGFSALSPAVQFDEATGEVTMITDESLLWGRSLIWGRSLLWGRSTPWATSLIWGRGVIIDDQSLIWGRSLLWGRSVVFGEGPPEGTSLIWGRNSPWSESHGAATGARNILGHGE